MAPERQVEHVPVRHAPAPPAVDVAARNAAGARPGGPVASAHLLWLQRSAGNAATTAAVRSRTIAAPQGQAPVTRPAVQRQDAGAPAAAAVGSRTGRPVDDLEREYRALVARARAEGYPVAAGNLEHFLTGGGAKRSVPLSWLRGFGVVTAAERKNHQRFQHQLEAQAKRTVDGASTTLADHWDAVVDASAATELFYASGKSQLRSTGTFELVRAGATITITGTVEQRWFDPYDWNAGMGAYIPGHGYMSDDVGLDLRDAGRGHDYLLENLYTQRLTGSCTIQPWYRPDSSTFTWSGP